MKSQVSCNIIQDLLPNYIENITTEETNEEVRLHLSECETCQNVYDSMTKRVGIELDEKLEEAKELKNGLCKTKRMYLIKGILEAVIILALRVPGIVILAVDGKFTLFYIVAASVTLLTAIVATAVLKKKYRAIATVGVLTVTVPVYLLLLEIVLNHYFLEESISWFGKIAFPITCVWLGFLSIVVLLFTLTKIKRAYCAGIAFVIATFGGIVTNWIAETGTLKEVLASSRINIISCVFCAVIAFIIGGIQSNRK